MSTDSNGVLVSLVALIVGIPVFGLVVLADVALGGFVLSKLWQWFVEPLGVQAINWIHGGGLMLIASWLRGTGKEGMTSAQAIAAILRPFLVLLIGYLISIWM